MDNLSVNEGKRKSLMEKVNQIPGIGLVMAMGSGISLATGGLTVKLVDSLSGIEIAVARSLVTCVLVFIFILFQRESFMPPSGERFPLLMRSVTGCIALIFSFSAIKLIPLGDSQSIVFSSPVFVSILGCLILKEPCGIVQIFSVFMAIGGIFLISRPSFIFPSNDVTLVSTSSNRTLGLTFALCSCLGASFTFICMRRLPKTPASVVVFWYSTFCVVAGTIVSFTNGTFTLPETLHDYGLLLLCGLTGLFGQGILTLALKIENAGPVSLARSIEIVMAFIYQVTILGESVSIYSGIGAIVLGIGVITVGLHKWYLSDPQQFNSIFCCKKKSNTTVNTFSNQT
ncbi:solute carrier family 35 member G1-like [Panonychus citri]|uniref:solute carrier family 35 member G1-like n=1 Tax=Panonychus citri TaxID=50023 RepID=UPI002306F740|nr:solute carrier family 35 member G1-like [Panonychus citri]